MSHTEFRRSTKAWCPLAFAQMYFMACKVIGYVQSLRTDHEYENTLGFSVGGLRDHDTWMRALTLNQGISMVTSLHVPLALVIQRLGAIRLEVSPHSDHRQGPKIPVPHGRYAIGC